MEEWAVLRDVVNSKSEGFIQEVTQWREEMLLKIKNAEDNAVVKMLQSINSRLTTIEAKLDPEPEEDDTE